MKRSRWLEVPVWDSPQTPCQGSPTISGSKDFHFFPYTNFFLSNNIRIYTFECFLRIFLWFQTSGRKSWLGRVRHQEPQRKSSLMSRWTFISMQYMPSWRKCGDFGFCFCYSKATSVREILVYCVKGNVYCLLSIPILCQLLMRFGKFWLYWTGDPFHINCLSQFRLDTVWSLFPVDYVSCPICI